MAAVVGRDQRGDRDKVVGIGRVAQAEHERDAERDEQRGSLEQVGEGLVDLLDRPEQELEVHHSSSRRAPAQSGQSPAIGKWVKRAS